jgi:AcrR family transcriptional regulator
VSDGVIAPGRRPRADARRNQQHILEVAEQFFAEHGVGGSLEAIAREAGVGPGTLYRHFPNREALIDALLRARAEALAARRDQIRDEVTDTTEALAQWLDAMGEWATAFDGLPDPLREAVTQDASPLTLTCQGFVTDTDEFLTAAQRDGGARPDIRGRDLFLGVLAAIWVSGAALADDSSTAALSAALRSGWATPRQDAARSDTGA